MAVRPAGEEQVGGDLSQREGSVAGRVACPGTDCPVPRKLALDLHPGAVNWGSSSPEAVWYY